LSAPVIDFLGAVKLYGNKRIGPVEFSVDKGEILGFLGPNGSGKTTCIRMLLGLARPSVGRVRLRGTDPLKNHVQALTGVGYSAELPNIQAFLTPRQVMELAAREIGMKTPAEEVKKILEEVGIPEYADVKVGRLSKGMVQRLSVAQAMLGSPEVMVMDEPMIGMDPAGTAHLREVFRGYARGGGTILMSSHMMSEVEDLCSSVALIHNGRLLFKGAPKEMEAKMLGADEVRVEAKGLTPAIIDVLRRVDGVLAVEEVEGELRVKVRQGEEARPAIARVIVGSGAELLAITEGERMLERAYIEALGMGRESSEAQ
jgi:ABC-2 type transport system ATP-binding protein